MTWVPFATRPEWSDVRPVPQDDGPDPVVAIQYSPQFRESMDYFRAVLLADERSERALGLTAEVIQLNSANYTVWHFRRLCLERLNSDLYRELDYIERLVEENPKNYQIWYHRRAIVDRLGDGSRELKFVASALEDDAKNYHAWAHRQWVLTRFGNWVDELNFIEELLHEDLRNNSAWNHRWFVVTHLNQPITIEVVRQEVAYALSYLEKAPKNESAWNYLRGWYRHPISPGITAFPDILAFCQRIDNTVTPRNRFVLSTLCDWHVAQNTEEGNLKALELCDELATKVDPTRVKFWRYKAHQLRSG